jgi:hypothetical protein
MPRPILPLEDVMRPSPSATNRPAAAARIAGVALTLLAGAAPASRALPLGVGARFDYAQEPAHEISRGAVGYVFANAGLVDVVAGGLRYDDSLIGEGNGALASVGLPMGAALKWRFTGTRFVGDDAFRGWRLRAGPEFSLAGRTLGLYLSHDDNNTFGTSNTGGGELTVPIAAGLAGRANAAWTSLGDAGHAARGALGADWSVRPNVALLGEVGLAQSGAAGLTPAPTRPGLLDPLLGGNDPNRPSLPKNAEATYQIGVRVSLP